MKKAFLIVAVLLISILSFSQKKKIPQSFCVAQDEKKLFDFVNTLREENGKKPVKLSKSLSFVAKTHVEDLLKNHPDTSICNLSSWSDKGNWKPCCYNAYVPKPLCMKEKPKELTSYPYYGYEFVSYFENKVEVDSVISLWKETEEVKQMILTNGFWGKKKWVIAGLAMNDHYVSVWFAQRPDVTKPPGICKQSAKQAATIVKKNEKEEKIKKPHKSSAPVYYVVYISLRDIKNAKEALKRTKKNGFKNAGIIESDGNYRIYLKKFDNAENALEYKKKLPTTYKNTWIFKK
jgi:hypothetical protein